MVKKPWLGVVRRGGLLLVAVLLLCTLSGCWRHAQRSELIDWFQAQYTAAPLVVAREATIDADGNRSYAAYLKAAPELVFQLRSEGVYVGEHTEYRKVTDFTKVYGDFYLAQYQAQYPVHYWHAPDASSTAFYLEALYANPAELAAAKQELLAIHSFLARQEPAILGAYRFNFQSPLCQPTQYFFSLGSGSVFLNDLAAGEDAEAAVARKAEDLLSELAVWCTFYDLHTDWFSDEALEARLAYTQSDDYEGRRPYIGERTFLYRDQTVAAYHERDIAPRERYLSFAQLYHLLAEVGWESLSGEAADFTFIGADGSTYAFSYTLRENEDGDLVTQCLKDGQPLAQTSVLSEGYLVIAADADTFFTPMTGLTLKDRHAPRLIGPDADGIDDGILELPGGALPLENYFQ